MSKGHNVLLPQILVPGWKYVMSAWLRWIESVGAREGLQIATMRRHTLVSMSVQSLHDKETVSSQLSVHLRIESAPNQR